MHEHGSIYLNLGYGGAGVRFVRRRPFCPHRGIRRPDRPPFRPPQPARLQTHVGESMSLLPSTCSDCIMHPCAHPLSSICKDLNPNFDSEQPCTLASTGYEWQGKDWEVRTRMRSSAIPTPRVCRCSAPPCPSRGSSQKCSCTLLAVRTQSHTSPTLMHGLTRKGKQSAVLACALRLQYTANLSNWAFGKLTPDELREVVIGVQRFWR